MGNGAFRYDEGMKGTIPGTKVGTDAQASFLDYSLVGQIEGVSDKDRWLIDGLWSDQAVGIVGGTPKTGKTWFTLELAVSVASGAPALGQFEVSNPGPVVVFPAEDDARAIRDRVVGIAAHKGVSLDGLPIHLITANTLRLDEEGDRLGLAAMLDRVRPKLVVLDPLVRLHGGDENYAGHVAELLGFLRSLQRRFECGILVTHHVAKRRGAKGGQMGQALRGSGELHAWGDSNIYLSRAEGGLVKVELEHRAAASPDPLHVALRTESSGTFLELVEVNAESDDDDTEEGSERGSVARATKVRVRKSAPASMSLRDQVLAVLAGVGEPTTQADLREVLRVRNVRLTDVLRELAEEGLVERPGGKRGWQVSSLQKSPVGDVL